MSSHALLDDLAWRGMLYQHTEGLGDALGAGPITGYCGFDPTAPSLHVGNLVPVMGLVHLQRAGHRPIALVGGGTGLIGDPSGKTQERQLNSLDVVEENARGIQRQLERFLDFTGRHAAVMRNNAEWLLPLGAIQFMRDIGKHFSINYMMAKESVRARLEGGISYTEFSYMLLQAYDYLELFRREGARLQIGGSDQWGNITAGIELIRRVAGAEAHALTFPLLTTASGTKFGKTEAGPVWLDPARTSPYRFYQFWINTEDRDVGRFLRYFTLLPREGIEALERETVEHPERRQAQQVLATDVTTRVHGEPAAAVAREISRILFGGAEVRGLSRETLEALAREAPTVTAEWSALAPQGAGADGRVDALTLATLGGLAKSRGEARKLVQQGGLSVNGERLTPERATLGRDEALFGEYFVVKKGARSYAIVRAR